jgi:nicotinamidase/pyrazinamidase
MSLAFLDIDTQIDFVFPSGALYAPGAERILPTIAKLNRYAMEHGIPLISTACAHAEDDPEFADWPPHCILGTVGQQKPASLSVGQRIFEKQTTDMFLSPNAEAVLEELGADEFVVYGVVTEVCVRFAALGLLKRGKRVTVVEDAVMHLDPAARQAFFEELKFRGGAGITTDSLTVAARNEVPEPRPSGSR